MATTNTTDGGLRTGSIGLPTAISATFGLILATTVMVTVPQLYAASTIGLYAMIIALVVMYAQVMSFSELATMIPKAGSMNEYVRAGLGPFFATVTVFVGYFAIVIFPGSSEAFLSATILSDPAFLDLGLTFKWWVVIIVVAIAIVNMLGIRAFAAIEVPLTFLLAASLLIFGVAGLAGRRRPGRLGPADDPVRHGPAAIAHRARHVHLRRRRVHVPARRGAARPRPADPVGHVHRSLAGRRADVPVGHRRHPVLPPDVLGDPTQITNMNVAIAMFDDLGKWWMGILSVAATISTLNAVAAGVPRIIYGMSQDRQLPKILGWLTPGTRAPAIGIILVSIPPIWLNVTDQTLEGGFLELILAGVLGWALAYIIIHISQIVLRIKEPQARRPYRSPLWPVPQLIGIVLLIVAMVNVFPVPEIESKIYRTSESSSRSRSCSRSSTTP